MKISTKGRYGLKAFMYIVDNENEIVSLRSISEKIKVSEGYLERLISALKKDKFVISVRGAKGGYKINCDINKTSVGDILRSLEGSLAPVECVVDDGITCGDGSCYKCNTKDVWIQLFEKINELIDSIMIVDLMKGK